MSDHPYKALPDTAFWRRTVAAGLVVPPPAPFRIAPSDRVATAGSCFAQHIGPMLNAIGFNWAIAETAHPMIDTALARAFGYGLFSARFGNVYSTRQLWQLWQRAYGEFEPAEDAWVGEGCWLDPFRPQIQPGGFASAAECAADRAQHLAAVRRMFETLDVFVFTLGLTQAWGARADGAVYPLCPGVAGGTFDHARHVFHDFSDEQVEADMERFITALRGRNPTARVILTVSPVPLVATASDEHVLVATMMSKSTLRVVAGRLARRLAGVAYFPSYEIVMSGAYGGERYFDPADCRSVTGPGVAAVMRAFAGSFTDIDLPRPAPATAGADAATSRMEALMAVHCDELLLDAS